MKLCDDGFVYEPPSFSSPQPFVHVLHSEEGTGTSTL
jgi:hypothetical protein